MSAIGGGVILALGAIWLGTEAVSAVGTAVGTAVSAMSAATATTATAASVAGTASVSAAPLAGAALAGAAGLVGAALVVGAGVGVCYVAGRGLVASADAIHRRCEEHAARSRAWEQTRRNLYRASLTATAPEVRQAQRHEFESYRRQQQQALARLAATQAWLSAPFGAPESFAMPPIDENMRVAWPEVGQMRIIDNLDVEAQRDRLESRRRAARRTLLTYAPGGTWEGLYDVTPIVNQLARADSELDQGRFIAAGEHLRQAERLLKLMESEAVERWGQRAAALAALQEADEQLRQAAALADEHPELLDQLIPLAEILTTAQQQQDGRDFANAAAMAQAVAQQAAVLVATPHLWRRELLLAQIDALRQEFIGHNASDLVAAHLRQLEAAEALIANDAPTEDALAQAAEMLDHAYAWATELLRRVEYGAAGSFARIQMAAHSSAQLKEMGYTVEWSHPLDAPPLPEETWRLTGRRPAPADPKRDQTFIIDLNVDGNVWFDVTQGYLDKECDDIKVFIQGLQRRGVEGFWEPFYSAEQAAARLREIFAREGYHFYEERNDDGLLYTLVKGVQLAPGARIGWDGEMKSAETDSNYVQSYLERIREEIEAAEHERSQERLRY